MRTVYGSLKNCSLKVTVITYLATIRHITIYSIQCLIMLHCHRKTLAKKPTLGQAKCFVKLLVTPFPLPVELHSRYIEAGGIEGNWRVILTGKGNRHIYHWQRSVGWRARDGIDSWHVVGTVFRWVIVCCPGLLFLPSFLPWHFFLDSSIQNVHQVYKACYIFSECLVSLFMKRKLAITHSLLTLVAPLVSALTINPPAGVIAGGTIDFTWITAPGDPYVNQTLTPFPFLTVFLAPTVTSTWLTKNLIFSTPFPNMLSYRWVLLVCSAHRPRLFLLGMLHIVSISVLCFWVTVQWRL